LLVVFASDAARHRFQNAGQV